MSCGQRVRGDEVNFVSAKIVVSVRMQDKRGESDTAPGRKKGYKDRGNNSVQKEQVRSSRGRLNTTVLILVGVCLQEQKRMK